MFKRVAIVALAVGLAGFVQLYPRKADVVRAEVRDPLKIAPDEYSPPPGIVPHDEETPARHKPSVAASRSRPSATNNNNSTATSPEQFRFTVFPPPPKEEVARPEMETETAFIDTTIPDIKPAELSLLGRDANPHPSSKKRLAAQTVKSKTITGYKLEIPQQVASTSGIPLRASLMTYCSTFTESGRQNGFVRLGTSFAQQEGNIIALYVPLRDVPTQTFTLNVAGFSEPFDGKLFMANAQPVYEKLPGPHHGARNLFSAASMGASGYALSAAFGPYAPVGMAGMFATRAIMRHHANALLKKAEKDYNAALAKGDTSPAPKKELQ
jgi:hypothetical protein